MSLKAIIWAIEDAPVEDPTATLVLIALADNANDDGTGCWPSVQTLTNRARCSRRTVQRHLRDLEAAGIIRQGNQALVAGYPPNRRPTVYDLNMAMVRAQDRGDNLTPQGLWGDTDDILGRHPEHSGASSTTSRGVTHDTQTVLEPPTKPTQETIIAQPLSFPAPDDRWEEFWKTYPRKVAKPQARKAWEKALKTTDAEVIIAGATRYRDDPNRLPQFTAHPATWLNAGRWDDDPLPGRAGGFKETHQDHWNNGGQF